MEGLVQMSMTRDTYAREVIKAAEAVFHRNEGAVCPHEDCGETLSVVRQNMFSTRSLFCPTHGHIFQEQKLHQFSKLDWDGAKERYDDEFSECDLEEEEEELAE
ncbi:MAG: hypothetical protein ACYC2Y_01035 [Armatimonadota bacterium]